MSASSASTSISTGPSVKHLASVDGVDITADETRVIPHYSRKRKEPLDKTQESTRQKKKPRTDKGIHWAATVLDSGYTGLGSNPSWKRALPSPTGVPSSVPVSPTKTVPMTTTAINCQNEPANKRAQVDPDSPVASSSISVVPIDSLWTPFTPSSGSCQPVVVNSPLAEPDSPPLMSGDSMLADRYSPDGSMRGFLSSYSAWDGLDFPEDMMGDLPITIEDLFPWDESSSSLDDQWVFTIPMDILGGDSEFPTLASVPLSTEDEQVEAPSTDEDVALSHTPLSSTNHLTFSAQDQIAYERSYPPANFVLGNNPETHYASLPDSSSVFDTAHPCHESTRADQEYGELEANVYRLLGLEVPPVRNPPRRSDSME